MSSSIYTYVSFTGSVGIYQKIRINGADMSRPTVNNFLDRLCLEYFVVSLAHLVPLGITYTFRVSLQFDLQ